MCIRDSIEAVMDVVVQWPTAARPRWVDVNIRSPYAPSVVGATVRPGAAAAHGDYLKHQRYGEHVLPLSLETGGRLSTEGLQTVSVLAGDSRMHGRLHFGRGSRGFAARALRAQLEAALLRAIADLTLAAMGAAVDHLLPRGGPRAGGQGGGGRGVSVAA